MKVTLTSSLQNTNLSARRGAIETETRKLEAALPPTRKGQATRERLLIAAETVFGRLGYEGTRVTDIADAAGVSHGLFYRHFADRDAALTAVLVRLNDRLRHTSGRSAGEALAPTLAQLERRNIAFFNEYAEHRHLLRLSREAAARWSDNGFRSMWLTIRGSFVERTRRWIEALALTGQIAPNPDPAMLAEGLSALTEQLAYVQLGLAAEEPDRAAIERLGRACALIWYRSLYGPAT